MRCHLGYEVYLFVRCCNSFLHVKYFVSFIYNHNVLVSTCIFDKSKLVYFYTKSRWSVYITTTKRNVVNLGSQVFSFL